MARKKKAQEETLWEKAKWAGFVNVTLNSQEKNAVKDALLSPDECSQFFMDASTAGYKVSLSYSPPEDVHTMALTGTYKGKANAGLTMSLRHRDYETLVSAMAWCLSEAGFDGSWEDRFGNVANDDW